MKKKISLFLLLALNILFTTAVFAGNDEDESNNNDVKAFKISAGLNTSTNFGTTENTTLTPFAQINYQGSDAFNLGLKALITSDYMIYDGLGNNQTLFLYGGVFNFLLLPNNTSSLNAKFYYKQGELEYSYPEGEIEFSIFDDETYNIEAGFSYGQETYRFGLKELKNNILNIAITGIFTLKSGNDFEIAADYTATDYTNTDTSYTKWTLSAGLALNFSDDFSLTPSLFYGRDSSPYNILGAEAFLFVYLFDHLALTANLSLAYYFSELSFLSSSKGSGSKSQTTSIYNTTSDSFTNNSLSLGVSYNF